MRSGRREFLGTAGVGLLGLAVSRRGLAAQGSATPTFKVSVRECGAKGDGVTKDTAAFQQAIDRCSAAAGGGLVMVPAGTYLIGGIALKSNVWLTLERGAVLKGSPDFADYQVGKVRWEGKWIDGYEALISARACKNIVIQGPGRIEGAHELGGRPTKDQPLRHPCLIEPIDCVGVRFSDFSTDYFRMWSIHPTYCEKVTIKGLTIRSTGGNGDGIDIDSTKHVTIDGCDISTGDDCISIKSGRGMEGFELLRTSEDIDITNCTFADSIFACIGIGSETSGGIRGVRIAHCKFTAAKTYAVYIKSRPGRGAFIEDISVDDCDVSGTDGGFLRINMANSGIQDEHPVEGLVGIPTVKNFSFRNIRVTDVPQLVAGFDMNEAKPLDGLVLENISGTAKRGITLSHVRNAVIKDISVKVSEGDRMTLLDVVEKGRQPGQAGYGPLYQTPVPAIHDPRL